MDRDDNDPAVWRERAAEARKRVGKLTDAEAKRCMVEIADIYEKLADMAERRRGGL